MKPRMLVIDDEEPIQQLLRFFFRRHGYEVLVAGTADEGLGRLGEAAIDIVILDIALADTDGLELLGTIKRAHPTVPVIMLTGMGFDDELENEAQAKGAAGYASKSLPLDQLLMQIRQVLRGGGSPASACPEEAEA